MRSRDEAPGLVALRRIFLALRAKGFRPSWTHDGRGIIADCPCCSQRGVDGRRALLIELSQREPRPAA